MCALIDAIRSLLERHRETPPHVVDQAIEHLEQDDEALDRRVRELRMRIEVQTRTTGRGSDRDRPA
jgi:hypothetical protein